MKALILAASALTLIAAPAFAQSASSDIQLNASVAKMCGTGNVLGGYGADPAWDQGDITVDLADANGQFGGQTFTNRSAGNLWCNAPANVSMTINPLKNTSGAVTSDTGSFTDTFNIKVNTDMGVYMGLGAGLTFQTNGSAETRSGNMPGAFETGQRRYSGFNSIEVLSDSGGSASASRRPLAGDYAGSITITATAI